MIDKTQFVTALQVIVMLAMKRGHKGGMLRSAVTKEGGFLRAQFGCLPDQKVFPLL
jgi:hypothetical protein